MQNQLIDTEYVLKVSPQEMKQYINTEVTRIKAKYTKRKMKHAVKDTNQRKKKDDPEAELKSCCINWILNQFIFCKHFSIGFGGIGSNAIADRLACLNGYFISIEAKYGDNSIFHAHNGHQQEFAIKIDHAGGLAICVNENNLDLLIDALTYVATCRPFAGDTESSALNLFIGLTAQCGTRHTFSKEDENTRWIIDNYSTSPVN